MCLLGCVWEERGPLVPTECSEFIQYSSQVQCKKYKAGSVVPGSSFHLKEKSQNQHSNLPWSILVERKIQKIL